MNMKKTIINTAITLAISSSAVAFNTAQAGALATSVVDLTNFTISRGIDANGNPIVLDANKDFRTLTFSSSADVSANINGSNNSAVHVTGSTTPSTGIDLFQSTNSTLANTTAGSYYTNNDFNVWTVNTTGDAGANTGAPTVNLAVGDQFEQGSPIIGVDGITTAGAHLANASYISLSDTGTGTSQTNNNLAASWTFSGVGGVLDFSFNLRTYLEVYLDNGSIQPTFANANYTVNFKITDLSNFGTTVLSQSFSGTQSASAPLANGLPLLAGANGWGQAKSQNIVFSTASLNAAHKYQLTASINTTVDATVVPEPSILALVGTGLLGLGFTRKQRAK